jgi:hypothetical protein
VQHPASNRGPGLVFGNFVPAGRICNNFKNSMTELLSRPQIRERKPFAGLSQSRSLQKLIGRASSSAL